MRELAISLEARDLARELALPSSAKQRAAECVEVAAERAQTVQRQEIPIADEMLRKLDDEIIELARADHDYEQVCASAPSLDCSSMHVLTTAPSTISSTGVWLHRAARLGARDTREGTAVAH